MANYNSFIIIENIYYNEAAPYRMVCLYELNQKKNTKRTLVVACTANELVQRLSNYKHCFDWRRQDSHPSET